MKRGARMGVALLALPCACQRVPEKAAAPALPPVTVIRHNDGTAERLATGAAVRFPGTLYLDFEHGAWVGNFMPVLPPPGTRVTMDSDFICAGLNIDLTSLSRLRPLSGRPVTVTGIIVPPPPRRDCPIHLDQVRVSPR